MIHHANLSFRNLFTDDSDDFDSAFRDARKACEPWFRADRFMPFDQLMIALHNCAHLVARCRFNQDDRGTVLQDFYAFIADLCSRNVNEGSAHVLVDYALQKIAKVRSILECPNQVWHRTVLEWDEARFRRVAINYGPYAVEKALTYKAKGSSEAFPKRTWDLVVDSVLFDSKSQVLDGSGEREMMDTTEKLLAGEELAGRLPTFLTLRKTMNDDATPGGHQRSPSASDSRDFNNLSYQSSSCPYAEISSNYSNNRYGDCNEYGSEVDGFANNPSSSGPSRLQSVRPGRKPYGRFSPYRGASWTPSPATNTFRANKPDFCAACGQIGHIVRDCSGSYLRLSGSRMYLPGVDLDGKTIVCRDFNLGICPHHDGNCLFSHSCGKCGKFGFDVRSCVH